MKQTVTEERTFCDRCGGDIDSTYSKLRYTCPVCKREICSNCKSGVMEKYPDLCRDCVELPGIKARKEAFIKDYWKRYREEENELKKLVNPSIKAEEL